MAEKILQTRIINKHTSYDVATSNDSFVPKLGEIILAKLDVQQNDGQTIPTFLMKVGDGQKTLKNLNWMHAPASDVYNWAKQATKPAYIATEITRGSSTVGADLTAAEQAIQALQTAIGGSGSVATMIEAAINALDVDASTDADGVIISSISETDGKISVTRRALTDADIADLNVAMAKVTGLSAALAAKADTSTTDAISARLNNGGDIKQAIDSAATAASDAQTYAEGVEDALDAYKTSNDAALAEVKATAEAARTESEVDDQIDAKINTFNTNTVNPLANRLGQVEQKATNNATAISGLAGDGRTNETVKGNADAIAKLAQDIGNVANVMNFRGVSTGTNPGDGITDPQNGDVIIFGEAEYVYDGSSWIKFGDASDNATAISDLQDRMASVEGKNTTQDQNIQTNATNIGVAQAAAEAAQAHSEGVASDLADEVARAKKAETDNLAEAKEYAEGQASTAQTNATNAAKEYTDTEVKKVDDKVVALSTTVSTNAQTAAAATKQVADDLAAYETANDAALDVVRTNAQKGVDDAAAASAAVTALANGQVAQNKTATETNATNIANIEANYAKVKATGDKYQLVVGADEEVIIFDCGGIE